MVATIEEAAVATIATRRVVEVAAQIAAEATTAEAAVQVVRVDLQVQVDLLLEEATK